MQAVTNATFGPLVAYLIPGATVLLGLSQFSPTLQTLFAFSPADAPTIGGFLYLTVASLAAGMTVSAVRWLVIDSLHSWTGIPPPTLDFGKLGRNVEALALLIDIHYKHFQFYSNMFVAAGISYACYRIKLGPTGPFGWLDALFLFVELTFFVTSRDNLRKYYRRTTQLLPATKGMKDRHH